MFFSGWQVSLSQRGLRGKFWSAHSVPAESAVTGKGRSLSHGASLLICLFVCSDHKVATIQS